ncbi:MAG: gliding motility-associated C-terminal domain-containing protein [Saprospiraceae bacterium]|nr:gliding motility-associated C-terminal domain-containing protein [Saprospiraceae bacterium]
MQRIFNLICLALTFVLLPSVLKATHIVGGEMNYTCLGDDQYEITLTIFRDCFNGDPNAWFDNPASIGIFDRENQLLQEVLVPLMNNDTLNPVLSGECFVVPPNVCVHTTTYRTTITLPPIIGGYQLAYQRCCRNQTIVNIVEPLATGATYGVTISEQALLECNSNPKFQEWPPLYICVDQPISFDQSAIDLDGDSIVYRLCTPLQGANQTIPQPQPPNPPPYQPISWIDPPYNVDNMLNGAPGGEPLQINPETGLLTGLPNTIGQFVVGICIEEYRDGKLISTTRRDFQYNVGICGQSVSSFFAPDIQCDDLTVEFENTSDGANNFQWLFLERGATLSTSTEVNPTFTFPDTGLYQVILIAEPEESCRDTFMRELRLNDNSLLPNFDLEIDQCSDTLFLHVDENSVDPDGMPLQWTWEILPEGRIFQGQSPDLFTTIDGEVTVRLEVTAANGCVSELEKTIVSNAIQVPNLSDTLQICRGETIRIGSIEFQNYQLEWSPSEGLDNPNLSNPQATPDSTTLYQLSISNQNQCFYQDSVLVAIDRVQADFPPDTIICEKQVLLSITSEEELSYQWSETPDFSELLSTDSTAELEPIGLTSYYLKVENQLGCQLLDTISVSGNAVDIEGLDTEIACLGDTVEIEFINEDLDDQLQIEWDSDPIILNIDGLMASVLADRGGLIPVTVMVQNQFGCEAQETIEIRTIDTGVDANFFTVTACSDYNVQFQSESPNAIFYRWDFGDPMNPNATAEGIPVSHQYEASGIYPVTILVEGNEACLDTFTQDIVLEDPQIVPDFNWEIQSCGDSTTIRFQNTSTNTQSSIIDWEWRFPDTLISGGEVVDLTFDRAQIIQSTLILESSDGCLDSLMQDISVPLIEALILDSLQLCFGDSIGLNPQGDPDLVYNWIPKEGLDNPASFNPLAGPLVSTSYSVLINTPDAICQLEQEVFVAVSEPLEYELPEDQILCEETFDLAVDAASDLRISWATDSLFQSLIGTSANLTVEPVGGQTYYLRLEDELGCVVEDEIFIDGQAIRVNLGGEETVCIGDTAELFVDALGQEGLMISWSPVERIIGPANTASILVSPSEDSRYEVSINNAAGCNLDTSLVVSIFNFIPPLDITSDRDTVREGESAQLMATENEGYIYQWEADPSLDVLDVSDPMASPSETTTYRLNIRDQNGCLNEAFITIVVFNPACLPPFIYVPNAFTPNGDGRNDEFRVFGDPIDELELIIYDRWGEKVFESSQKGDGWDGTFRGKALAPDVYAYYVRVACFDGEEYITKGNVTLIR